MRAQRRAQAGPIDEAGHQPRLAGGAAARLGGKVVDAGVAEPVPMRAHHLAEAPRHGFQRGAAVDGDGAIENRPARRLGGRIGHCARLGRGETLGARARPLCSRQAAVEIVAFEADQRPLLAVDGGEHLAAALHLGDGEQRGALDLQLIGDLRDFPDDLVCEHVLSPRTASSGESRAAAKKEDKIPNLHRTSWRAMA